MIVCLLYGLLTPMFTAFRFERFVADFTAFFIGLWAWIYSFAGFVWKLGEATAKLADKIQNPIAAMTVHWLFLIVVVGGIGTAVLGCLIWGSKKMLEFYKEDYADTQSLAAFLISLAVAVFFAEPIREFISLNLLFLLILVHAAYIGVRWYLENKSGW